MPARDRPSTGVEPSVRAPARGPILVLVVGLLATTAVSYGFHRSIDGRDRAEFAAATQAAEDRLGRRLDTYVAVLEAVRGLFAADPDVTPQEFARFVSELDVRGRYPGIQGIGYSLRLSPEDREAVEARLRAQGQTGFRVWPEGPREELHTIAYLEPLDRRNRAALGYDMFSEPVRRAAMARARDTGEPAATGKVTLVQEIDVHKQAGFLVYVPIYRDGIHPQTVAERREALVGFAYSPFRMDDLLAGVFAADGEAQVALRVFDGPTPTPEALMHASPGLPSDPHETAHRPFEIAGQRWTIEFRSLPPLEAGSSRHLVPWVIGLGLLVSGLLFQVSRAQALAHARERAHAQTLDAHRAREADARAEAEAASRAKDEFLAMLGHELRNPLAPIVTALQLLRQQARGAASREQEVIERQVQHLVRLVDDLLDVSRITRRKVVLKKAPCSIQAVVAKAAEMASPLLDERRHHLAVEVEPGLRVTGDEIRLAQIVGNLLTNAAKYTEPGGHIRVRARREDDRAVVRVEDDGTGIAPDMIGRIFDLFTQGSRGLDRSQGGLGIGLTLVRSLVEMHGGTVEAVSAGEGLGSEFIVRLPALPARAVREQGAAEAAPSPLPVPARAAGEAARRVLVVDDNEDAAELLADLLRAAGHEVEVAYDGPRALEVAARTRPEIAVLDIGLPVMDGYELGARLLEDGHRPILVAVTGYGQESDVARSREVGFAEHLVKPVDPARLLAFVAQAGPGQGGSPSTADDRPGTTEPPAPQLR